MLELTAGPPEPDDEWHPAGDWYAGFEAESLDFPDPEQHDAHVIAMVQSRHARGAHPLHQTGN